MKNYRNDCRDYEPICITSLNGLRWRRWTFLDRSPQKHQFLPASLSPPFPVDSLDAYRRAHAHIWHRALPVVEPCVPCQVVHDWSNHTCSQPSQKKQRRGLEGSAAVQSTWVSAWLVAETLDFAAWPLASTTVQHDLSGGSGIMSRVAVAVSNRCDIALPILHL